MRRLANVMWNGKGLLILTSILAITVTSCRMKSKKSSVSFFQTAKFDEDDVADVIEAKFSSKPLDDSAWTKKKMHGIPEIMHYTYRSYEYLPLWVNENGNMKAAEAFVDELDSLIYDGIDPKRYHVAELRQQIKTIDDTKNPDVNALVALDTALTRTYLQAAHDLVFGLVPASKADNQWFHGNDSAWNPEKNLVDILYGKEEYPSLDVFRSKIPTYAALRKAKQRYYKLNGDPELKNAKAAFVGGNRSDSIINLIASKEVPQGIETTPADTSVKPANTQLATFQQYYGLAANGKMDSNTVKALGRQPMETASVIDANLERLRWLPWQFAETYILVNVPLQELFFRRDGKDVMHMRVIVGKPERQTPALYSNMENVVFNPSWGVPPTILKKDVIPGVERSGQAYLAKKDLVVYDRKGNKVDPSIVNGSNYKQFVFRQPPGDDNALGLIKFNMPNKWDIYLHDTPNRNLFSKNYRALSSGCVRVEQPQEMAKYILNELDNKNYDQQKIDQVIATQNTKFVNLDVKLPVHIVYLTAFERGDDVVFLNDMYKRDQQLITLLSSSYAVK